MKPVAVIASGMVTSVGFNAQSTCAAVRAGLRMIEDELLWNYEFGDSIATGKVSLPHWWTGVGKLVGLVAPAIEECLNAATPALAEDIPILLGLPQLDRPARWANLEGRIFAEIETSLGFSLHRLSQVIPRGNVSGVQGVYMASCLIEESGINHCIVAGVDSFIDQEMIAPYLIDRRILTTTNSNGFSPAEAGAAVLLAAPSRNPDGELRVLGTALAEEPSTINSEEPLRGEGLCKAIYHALASSCNSISDIDYFITDLNGEYYKFKEAALAALRLWNSNDDKGVDYWHPIESFGEVGAAIGPCALGLALIANQKGYAPSPSVLFHFSNDDRERAALVARFEKHKN
jgi:3-oxoacyl-[acyl-carrier-protein] synthase-1